MGKPEHASMKTSKALIAGGRENIVIKKAGVTLVVQIVLIR
jgi:hypothetical protein